MLSRRSFLSHASAGAAGLYAATLVRSRLREQYAFAAEMGIAPEEAINLANNENSLGPGDFVMDALDSVIGPEGVIAGRYPFRFSGPVREAIAEKWGVKPENVLVGAGSTQILVDCTHQYASREKALVGSLPTYEECFGYANLMGYRTKAVPLTADFKMDLDQTLHACKGSGMLFYCNPNNPVATLVDPAQSKDFLMRALDVEKNLRILVDEAYIDYVTTPGHETLIPTAIENPRLIVARTFSKAYGMAGLRVGYAIAHEDTIAELDEFHLGNSVSTPALVAANAALERDKADPDYLPNEKKRNAEARDFIIKFFADRGLSATDAQTNFIFVDVPECRSSSSRRPAPRKASASGGRSRRCGPAAASPSARWTRCSAAPRRWRRSSTPPRRWPRSTPSSGSGAGAHRRTASERGADGRQTPAPEPPRRFAPQCRKCGASRTQAPEREGLGPVNPASNRSWLGNRQLPRALARTSASSDLSLSSCERG